MDDAPLIRVVRGNPTPEEIAALLMVISAGAAASRTEEDARDAAEDRARRARLLRGPVVPGPGAWRAAVIR
ncbi:hypothetical protein GCM10009530_35260 [Microbispora corallina]|uniref:Acyl-CoA carboxylase subunit epsilon n=1 Tax=Microbispora corallina TaxID=83302 RepID=A0ABQ4FYR3_9ACTN|nr:acyl-CoA carboxylase subunit epsilon [Microbispora corallina]GIH39938.1 hypothetical protein Mco01_29380 [Microbispora corallina]